MIVGELFLKRIERRHQSAGDEEFLVTKERRVNDTIERSEIEDEDEDGEVEGA